MRSPYQRNHSNDWLENIKPRCSYNDFLWACKSSLRANPSNIYKCLFKMRDDPTRIVTSVKRYVPSIQVFSCTAVNFDFRVNSSAAIEKVDTATKRHSISIPMILSLDKF